MVTFSQLFPPPPDNISALANTKCSIPLNSFEHLVIIQCTTESVWKSFDLKFLRWNFLGPTKKNWKKKESKMEKATKKWANKNKARHVGIEWEICRWNFVWTSVRAISLCFLILPKSFSNCVVSFNGADNKCSIDWINRTIFDRCLSFYFPRRRVSKKTLSMSEQLISVCMRVKWGRMKKTLPSHLICFQPILMGKRKNFRAYDASYIDIRAKSIKRD